MNRKNFIVLLIILVSCQKQTGTQDTTTVSSDKIELSNDSLSIKILNLTTMEEKEIKMYVEKYLDDPDHYMISEAEMNLEIRISRKYLQRKNYKFVADTAFNERINQIFDIDKRKKQGMYEIIEHPRFFYVSISPYFYRMTMSERATYIKEDGIQSGENIVFAKNDNFIIIPMPLGEFFDKEGDDLFLSKKYADEIFHYNNYLFNNSQASLTWLITNDMDFLNTLVTDLNYDKDNRINEAVLNKALKNYVNFHNDENALRFLFASKDYNNSLQIRERLMQYIVDNTTVKNNDLLNMLNDYASLSQYSDNIVFEEFTQKERYKIAAYAGYYIQKTYIKNNVYQKGEYYERVENWDGSFLRNYIGTHQSLLEEIEKNDYYGLPDYKDIIEGVLGQIEVESEEYLRTHDFSE